MWKSEPGPQGQTKNFLQNFEHLSTTSLSCLRRTATDIAMERAVNVSPGTVELLATWTDKNISLPNQFTCTISDCSASISGGCAFLFVLGRASLLLLMILPCWVIAADRKGCHENTTVCYVNVSHSEVIKLGLEARKASRIHLQTTNQQNGNFPRETDDDVTQGYIETKQSQDGLWFQRKKETKLPSQTHDSCFCGLVFFLFLKAFQKESFEAAT